MPITSTPYPVAPYSAGANTYTTTGSNAYTVPATSGGAPVSGVYVYLWGAGGGYNTIGGGGYVPGSAGGGGGFVSGFYSCSPGTNLIYVVGAVGVQSGSASALSNGGPGNPINPSPGGGGFSGLFLSNAGGIAQSNAIAIAGGGGGGGFEFGYMGYAEYGGGGGYPSGDNVGYDDGTKASSSYSGGSQTAGGLGDGPGSALLGGRSYVGGGGGGWYGGSGNGNGYAGTGGSSYIGNVNGATGGIGLTSGSTYENGITLTSAGMPASNAKPGGTTNQYYVSGKGVGNGGTGLVVIVPATQQRPTGAPVTRVPLTLTPYTQYAIQAYTGDYIYYSVPKNATGITFYMWGAGGGFVSNSAAYAGGGAFLTGILAISPGEQIRIIVGMGGKVGSAFYPTGTDAQGGGGGGGFLGGMGGGRSAIQKYIGGTWTEVVTAGGGGGAANNAGDYGGNAYYTGTSQSGGQTYGHYSSVATGGSATAAGTGVTITGQTYNYPSNNGGPFYGGTALNNIYTNPFTGQAGGGGGGGYYGGGGGGTASDWPENIGGGGGGSYYNATYVSNFSGSNGNNITAVASSYSFYDGAAGRASATNSVPGSNGLVVLAPSYIRISATKTSYPVAPYSAGASNYTTAGSNLYTVPATAGGSAVSGVYIYLLGCAGCYGNSGPGGGGGFVSGFYSCAPGTKLIYVVGGTSSYNLNVAYGGGAAQGGGFSGVFLSNAGGIVQSNAIAIAGGGGGGGYFGIGYGGGGGYPNGYSGTQGNTYGTIGGGTQTAGGAGGNPGSALLGGAASTGNGAQGGGGGWFGGGSGFAYSPDGTFPDRPAGCGGSSYIGNVNGATGGIGLTSGAYYEQGFTSNVVNTYAGSSSPYFVSWQAPFVVIVPATIQYPTPFSANT